MKWAEEFGVGEMGLSPEAFWSLTVREFWIKHAAFTRAENRMRSLVFELVSGLRTGQSDQQRNELLQDMHALRRYPIKAWLR